MLKQSTVAETLTELYHETNTILHILNLALRQLNTEKARLELWFIHDISRVELILVNSTL